METIERYTTYAARQMHEDGRRASWLQIAGHPPMAFLRNYVLKGGITDGVPGLVISAMNAYYVFLKFAKLWELQSAKVPEFHNSKVQEFESSRVRDSERGNADAQNP
jgi:hypothetical protein